jgi:transcriptional regulator with PAS, ATPase and Fis domain
MGSSLDPYELHSTRSTFDFAEGLAAHMLEQLREDAQRDVKHISADALEAMAAHPWPGNLRELRHAVQRGAVMARPRTVITAADLGLNAVEGPDGATLEAQVERLERRAITNALALEGGNRSRAARRR